MRTADYCYFTNPMSALESLTRMHKVPFLYTHPKHQNGPNIWRTRRVILGEHL